MNFLRWIMAFCLDFLWRLLGEKRGEIEAREAEHHRRTDDAMRAIEGSAAAASRAAAAAEAARNERARLKRETPPDDLAMIADDIRKGLNE